MCTGATAVKASINKCLSSKALLGVRLALLIIFSEDIILTYGLASLKNKIQIFGLSDPPCRTLASAAGETDVQDGRMSRTQDQNIPWQRVSKS